MDVDIMFQDNQLKKFTSASEDELRAIFAKPSSKYCNLHSLKKYMKKCIGQLLPIITDILNKSTSGSLVPPNSRKVVQILC